MASEPYRRSDFRRPRTRCRLPLRCRLGRKVRDQRAGFYTYEDRTVVSEYDGLVVAPENADPSPEVYR